MICKVVYFDKYEEIERIECVKLETAFSLYTSKKNADNLHLSFTELGFVVKDAYNNKQLEVSIINKDLVDVDTTLED